MSKYHAVLLPAGVGLYLLVRPSALRILRTPGPYLGMAIGGLMFTPVIAWNAAHGWASFAYQSNRAGGFHGLQPEMFLEALVGQILYMTPWIWVSLLVVLVGLLRRGLRSWSAAEAFLVCEALPVLALFMSIATFRRIMPHWPLIGFVALMPLLGRVWAQRFESRPRVQGLRFVAIGLVPVVLGCLFVVQARTGLLQDDKGRLLGVISPRVDPTVDTIRWRQIAAELRRRGLLDEPNTFFFTEGWRFSSELAMAADPGNQGTIGAGKDVRDAIACYHRDSRASRSGVGLSNGSGGTGSSYSLSIASCRPSCTVRGSPGSSRSAHFPSYARGPCSRRSRSSGVSTRPTRFRSAIEERARCRFHPASPGPMRFAPQKKA